MNIKITRKYFDEESVEEITVNQAVESLEKTGRYIDGATMMFIRDLKTLPKNSNSIEVRTTNCIVTFERLTK